MTWQASQLVGNGEPRWLQLAEIFRRAIESGKFPIGATLPTEAEINAHFGVSRTTTRAAMQRLVQEGLIYRRAGFGTVVVGARVDQPANRISSFADDMRSRGMKPGYEVLGCGMAAGCIEAAHGLGLPAGDAPFFSERLLKANDRLIGHSISWVRPDIFGQTATPTQEDLTQGSLYDWLHRNLGIRIAGGVEYIEAGLAPEHVRDRLDLAPGDPVLIARRIARSLDGVPIEFAVINYRADRYRFRVDL